MELEKSPKKTTDKTCNGEAKEQKLWNKNFFLLWQGQLVSSFGSVVYSMALGFWVLDITGSTALMGSIMAATSLPRVILGPLAGVWVDRLSRKWIIVLTDVARGLAILIVAIQAFLGNMEVWMLFIAAIIMGLSAAFFNPAMGSVVPDIVPKSKIVKANSFYSMASTGTEVVGSVTGGFLYTLLGAPSLFLFNSISYFFSAFTEVFMKIPKASGEIRKSTFKKDFIEGINFSWKVKVLRYLMILSCGINFFFQMAFTLLMPMFKSADGLGEKWYGIIMGIMTTGMLLGMLFLSIKNIKSEKKYSLFIVAALCNFIFSLFMPIFKSFYSLSTVFLIAGFSNAILNTVLNSALQLIIPDNMRGKVFSIINTLAGGLAPIGALLAGVLGEFLPIRLVIFISFALSLAVGVPIVFIKSLKKFINYDPELDKLHEVLEVNNSEVILEG